MFLFLAVFLWYKKHWHFQTVYRENALWILSLMSFLADPSLFLLHIILFSCSCETYTRPSHSVKKPENCISLSGCVASFCAAHINQFPFILLTLTKSSSSQFFWCSSFQELIHFLFHWQGRRLLQAPLTLWTGDGVEFRQCQQVFSSVFVGFVRLHSGFIFAMPLLISIVLQKTPSFSSQTVWGWCRTR